MWFYFLTLCVMKNINQMDVTVQKDRKFLYKFGYPVLLFSLLNFNNLAQAHSYTSVDKTMAKTEIFSWDFLSQLDSKLWVKLPQWYDSKVRNMLETNVVLKNEYNRKFTQDFIISEMQKNRWISKQNQLLFIWSAIYLGMENKELYDGEDGDEKRLNEFEIAVDFVENCGNNYMKGLNAYIQQNIKESQQYIEQSQQHIEQSQQHIQESIGRIMSLDSAWLKSLNNIYDLYKKDPSSVTAWELEQARKSAAHIISDCKKYGIDYKKLLSLEVRRFYGIE